MDGPLAGATVVGCLVSATLAGVVAHAKLPPRVLRVRTSMTIQGVVALVACLGAILLMAMAMAQKTSFDSAQHEVQRLSSQVVQLDRMLRQAGPESEPARDLLFRFAVDATQTIWPQHDGGRGHVASEAPRQAALAAAIARLDDGSPRRQAIVSQAQRVLNDAEQTRAMVQTAGSRSLSPVLAGVTVLWLMVTFASAGLSAPQRDGGGNAGIMMASVLGAVTLGAALLLLREYSNPFSGMISISHEPLQNALFAISE